MKFHYKMGIFNDVWIQFLALALLMALSVDSLNPIKSISSFLGIPAFYWAPLFFAMMLMLLYSNLSDAIYRCVSVFLHSILSISFKEIEVIGLENIPKEGPVIFTGNHANQFVDGLVVLMNTPRKVGFMLAEKSFDVPVVGEISRIMGCIPVVRPQDSVRTGTGKVQMATMNPISVGSELSEADRTVIGIDTKFLTEVAPGDQLRFQGDTVKYSGAPSKVLQVISDTKLILERKLLNAQDKLVTAPSRFGIFKKVDQSVTFAKVYTHLKRGNCIGIFPEGGSHDRTDLLPLKAGIAIMALGVKDKYDINATVVPVGLTYFRGHRFRARVRVEYGTPLAVDDHLMAMYAKDKRAACNSFLIKVEEAMRSVIVTTPNYHIMQLVFAARRLYQRSGVRLSPKESQDLNRRFAEGYKILSTLPEASADLEDLHKELDEYTKRLKEMGLKDHQVPFIPWWTIHDVIGTALYGLFIFLLASIPSFVLNAPVGFMARYLARKEQERALAGSKVKLAGRDVVLSKKIAFSIFAVPCLWLIYFLLAVCLTDWYWSSIVLLLLSFPLFSFFGVRSVEAGIIELKTVRPLFKRLLPRHRKLQDELPAMRIRLQVRVHTFIEKYKTELGELVTEKNLDWNKYMHDRAIKASHEIEKKKEVELKQGHEQKQPEPIHYTEMQHEYADGQKTGRETITKDHDLSFFRRSNHSLMNLAGMERSMK